MRICGVDSNHQKNVREHVNPPIIRGHVYRMIDKKNILTYGSLYFVSIDITSNKLLLVNLSNGSVIDPNSPVSDIKFEDVTEYVCLNTSKLPPIPQ